MIARHRPKSLSFATFLLVPLAAVTAWPASPASAQTPQSPEVKAAVRRAVAFLRESLSNGAKNGEGEVGGPEALAAYAMIKGGTHPTDAQVSRVIAGVLKRAQGGKYTPTSHIIYSTGCELMLLEAAEHATNARGKYGREMQAIVDYVAKNQSPKGYWNYLGGDEYGDTSVTQYGILGLWAAARSGIDVPPQAWDKAAGWLIAHQGRMSGGFRYRPTNTQIAQGESFGMTVAGVSTLLVARRYLYPGSDDERAAAKKRQKRSTRGGLVKEDLDPGANPGGRGGKKRKPSNYKPAVSLPQLNGAIRAGLGNVSSRFSPTSSRFPYYTLYGVERLAALSGTVTFGKHNWYKEGARFLLNNQRGDGSWNASLTAGIPATSFGVLFLSRATFQILGGPGVDLIGEGLLRGSRGLPDDLSTIVEGKDGAIKSKRISGPIDELLTELMSRRKLSVPDVQQAIVEKIQLGSEKERKKWLEPKRRKQLLRMVDHPRPAVRQVAIWALGRTGNVDVASIILHALEKDPDLDVAVEARNALCWLSRKPRGFGLPETPRDQFPEGATKDQQGRIIREWREQAVQRWKTWYLTVRPYSERDDLQEIDKGR